MAAIPTVQLRKWIESTYNLTSDQGVSVTALYLTSLASRIAMGASTAESDGRILDLMEVTKEVEPINFNVLLDTELLESVVTEVKNR